MKLELLKNFIANNPLGMKPTSENEVEWLKKFLVNNPLRMKLTSFV